MFSLNPTKACTKVKKMTRRTELSRALEKMKDHLTNTTPSQSLQKNEIQDAIDRLKKGKAKDSSDDLQ